MLSVAVALLMSIVSVSLDLTEAHDHARDLHHTEEHGHEEHSHEESVILLSQDQIKELGIQTEIAGPKKLSVMISSRGKIVVHPDRLVHILPKIPGVAKEARKNIGDHVKAEEVLAILESREMAEIKANYLAAKEKEHLSLSLLEREKHLYDKRVSAQQDYINAKSASIEAKINLQLAKQKLHAFGIDENEMQEWSYEHEPDLRLYEVRSPMEGLVIARHINRGEFIDTSATIYEIVDLSVVWIEIGIYPKDLVKVKEGQMVEVLLSADQEIAHAKIIYLSPIIQDETITAKAVAELKNPGGSWRPGSFVTVNIATESVDTPLAVPKEAIQEMDGKPFVFVKILKGFEKREVELGREDKEHVEILAGLKAKEEYASSKTFLLKADLSKGQAEHTHQ